MNTTTLERSPVGRTADPIALSLTKAMTLLLSGLNALDKKLSERPARIGQHAAELLRLAESYEESQPSYAADLRAAAMAAVAQQGAASR